MRVALYARVSVPQSGQSQSIDDQLERLRVQVQRQGWDLPEEQVFCDDGFSGATLRRPGLDRLRDAVAASTLDRVLITAPDRLARNYVHQMVLLEELERFGCQVEFLDRPMSQDPHDQLLLQIRSAVAEYERTLIAERMRRGRQRKMRAGLLLPWPRTPYGYRLSATHPRDPAGVWVEVTEAAVVQEIFARYLSPGGTLLSVAKSLQAESIPTPRGHGYWNVSTIGRILSNPVYLGQVYAGRYHNRPTRFRQSPLKPVGRRDTHPVLAPQSEWVRVATIPQLISQEQFDQVQAKLGQNKQRARRNNTTHEYLLRALVSCGVCKLSCTGRMKTSGYRYYLCHTKTEANPPFKCRAPYIPAQQLDDLVWQDLSDLLTHPEIIAQALARVQAGSWLPQELQTRREQLRKGRMSLEGQLERLTDAYQGGILPLDEYQRRRHAIEDNQQVLERQAEHLLAQVDRQHELAEMVTSLEAFCQRVSSGLSEATFAQKRQLVELLIDRVVVTKEEVEIRYVFPTSPKSEHTRFGHLRTDYLLSPS